MKLKRKPEKQDYISAVILVALIAIFAWLWTKYSDSIGALSGGDLISSAENLKKLILSYGNAGVLVLIFLHILQVLISVIPAAIVQIAGGLIYGIPFAVITGIIGVFIGTAITFYMSRLLGRRFVTLFVSEKNLDELEKRLSSNTSSLVLFLLYVIPFPKDFIAYFVGLTGMKASKLLLISTIGRIPGMFVAAYLGSNLISRNYIPLIAVTVFCCVSFIVAYIYKDKFFNFISKHK